MGTSDVDLKGGPRVHHELVNDLLRLGHIVLAALGDVASGMVLYGSGGRIGVDVSEANPDQPTEPPA